MSEAIKFFWVAAILVGRSERGNKRYFILGLGTSPMPLKGCKILIYARRLGLLSRKGSLSCHMSSVFPVSFEEPPPFSRFIRHPWGWEWPILARPETQSSDLEVVECRNIYESSSHTVLLYMKDIQRYFFPLKSDHWTFAKWADFYSLRLTYAGLNVQVGRSR